VQALKFASGIGPLTQFAVGGVLYVGSFLVWLYILSKSQVTYAYPVSVALTVVFTTLGAILFLGERFSWSMFGGILLILGGIALLTIRSN
jgi:multidrug transporter EmrE-like cation transporter